MVLTILTQGLKRKFILKVKKTQFVKNTIYLEYLRVVEGLRGYSNGTMVLLTSMSLLKILKLRIIKQITFIRLKRIIPIGPFYGGRDNEALCIRSFAYRSSNSWGALRDEDFIPSLVFGLCISKEILHFLALAERATYVSLMKKLSLPSSLISFLWGWGGCNRTNVRL